MQSQSHFPVKFLDRKVAADLRAADCIARRPYRARRSRSTSIQLHRSGLVRAEPRKARFVAGGGFHRLKKHRRRPHPESVFTIQCLINYERLERLGVTREPDHAILAALVMAIAAGLWLGGKGSEGIWHERGPRLMWKSGKREWTSMRGACDFHHQ